VVSTVHQAGLPGFRSRFRTALAEARPGASVVPLFSERVFPGGILPVLEVVEGRRRYAVFGYADATPDAGSHFAGARDLLATRGVEALWYCPEPLAVGTPSNPLVQFDPQMMFRESRSKVRAKQFATWWPTVEQPRFAESPARDFLGRGFRAMDGLEAWFFAMFSRELELPPFAHITVTDTVRRQPLTPAKLPRREKLVPAMGPEQCLLVFRASAEKGLLLAFQIGTTGADYRDSLLGAFASYCEAYRAELLARGITPALDPACRPLDWWTLLEAASENEERASGSGVNIGMLGFEG